jgi:hypothetical protein
LLVALALYVLRAIEVVLRASSLAGQSVERDDDGRPFREFLREQEADITRDAYGA